MKGFADQCAKNRVLWKERLTQLTAPPDERDNYPPMPYRPSSPPQPNSHYSSVFPMSLPADFTLSDERLPSLFGEGSGASPEEDSRSPSPFAYGSPAGGSSPPSARQVPAISTQSIPRFSAEMWSASASAVSSPRSDVFSSTSTPRTPAGENGSGTIRGALKLSVRKKKSFHRNSWTPSLGQSASPPLPMPLPGASALRGLFEPPLPNGPSEVPPAVPAKPPAGPNIQR